MKPAIRAEALPLEKNAALFRALRDGSSELRLSRPASHYREQILAATRMRPRMEAAHDFRRTNSRRCRQVLSRSRRRTAARHSEVHISGPSALIKRPRVRHRLRRSSCRIHLLRPRRWSRVLASADSGTLHHSLSEPYGQGRSAGDHDCHHVADSAGRGRGQHRIGHSAAAEFPRAPGRQRRPSRPNMRSKSSCRSCRRSRNQSAYRSHRRRHQRLQGIARIGRRHGRCDRRQSEQKMS